MGIKSLHPAYEERVEDWELSRDCMTGDRAIRAQQTKYLPVPPGMEDPKTILMDSKRYPHGRYSFYASFAQFPEIVSPTVNGIQGLIHEKPPKVGLPPDMEYLLDSATPDGEPLFDLWERQTREILITGRFVMLGEVYEDQIYICPYVNESLINWRLQPKRIGGGPNLIVLKEKRQEPDPNDVYMHREVNYYRELSLSEDGAYQVRVFRELEGKEPELVEDFVEPALLGRTFPFIPLSVVNALSLGYEYDAVPIIAMCRRAVTIFRKSADYHRALYMKGDPQVVIFGVQADDVPTEIGGGTIWAFENEGGSTEYLDIDGQGIPLMRQAINDEYARFSEETGRLFDGIASGYESGEALRRRHAMQQVTVKGLVINAAQGMQHTLRMIGAMMGKSDEELKGIIFEPNLDFTEPMMSAQELREFVTAMKMGAPLSQRSLHDLMRKRQVTGLDFDNEMSLIEGEDPLSEEEDNDESGGDGGADE